MKMKFQEEVNSGYHIIYINTKDLNKIISISYQIDISEKVI